LAIVFTVLNFCAGRSHPFSRLEVALDCSKETGPEILADQAFLNV
jgi:hypothetical protein